MQQSWRTDHNKLTFIICQPLAIDNQNNELTPRIIQAGKHDSHERMIGDVNLFLCEQDEEPEDGVEGARLPPALVGEVEIMVARKDMRGRGIGKAALSAFLRYVALNEEAICAQYCARSTIKPIDETYNATLRFTHLRIKVNADNIQSIGLFERFGFKKLTEKPNFFGELELRHVREETESVEGYTNDDGGSCIFLGYSRQEY
jgi:RimJ/RimL family protein N-acetyltransferase